MQSGANTIYFCALMSGDGKTTFVFGCFTQAEEVILPVPGEEKITGTKLLVLRMPQMRFEPICPIPNTIEANFYPFGADA